VQVLYLGLDFPFALRQLVHLTPEIP
jgi:hypothetical protein